MGSSSCGPGLGTVTMKHIRHHGRRLGDLIREAPWGQVGRAGVEWQTSVESPTNCRKAKVWAGGWRRRPIAIKGFRFALGVLESCRRVWGGSRLYDPGAELCRVGSDMGRRRARIGGTLKEDLVSSFLASNPPAITVCAGSPSEGLSLSGGHSFPCATSFDHQQELTQWQLPSNGDLPGDGG